MEFPKHNKGHQHAPRYSNPARYRLDFIKENTFNRLWSVRMTRLRVIVVSAAAIAALCALIWCVIAYTPLRGFMPGALKGDIRAQYIETALRVDSLELSAKATEAYLANLQALMKGEIDSVPSTTVEITVPLDSLAGASEAERDFVRRFEEEERFNLSVLAPIAAEGMVFASPHPLSVENAVAAVYRGTVVSVITTHDGTSTVTVQHPNDFVSVYTGLTDVFVSRGSKVVAGQRMGHGSRDRDSGFELWHNGALLQPDEYVIL